MGTSTKDTTRKATAIPIACQGLAQHEAALVRLVLEFRRNDLNRDWTLTETEQASALILDPQTAEGRQALATAGRHYECLISVLDQHKDAPQNSNRAVYRPLRPSTIIRALNDSVATAGTGCAANTPAEILRAPLTDALRHTFKARDHCAIAIVDDFVPSPLAIDPQRDVVHGAIDQLTFDRLAAATLYTVTYYSERPDGVPPIDDLADHLQERLSVHLWRILYSQGSDSPLFPVSEPMQLSQWPNLSATRMTRDEVRALTLLRRGVRGLGDLAKAARVEPATLVPLLNYEWLVGGLEVSEEIDNNSVPAAEVDRGDSLISRIRNVLGLH